MMYLSRLILNDSRRAFLWVSNPYHVHQRLMVGCEDDPRLLFRIEVNPRGTQILVQTQTLPQWENAFGEFSVLRKPPECKSFDLSLAAGAYYRFRLLANPTVRRNNGRLGILTEKEQRAWVERKLRTAGAEVMECLVIDNGFQHSHKTSGVPITHLAIQFDGVLHLKEPELMVKSVIAGIGSAKGFGFGLLSLAPFKIF